MTEFDDFIDEAKEEFDLGAYLDGTSQLTETVELFTDRVTAKELGVDEDSVLPGSTLIIGRTRRGLHGEFADLRERLKEIAAEAEKAETDEARDVLLAEVKELQAKGETLRKQIAKAIKKLESTAIEIELQSIPEKVLKSVRKKARGRVGAKGDMNEEQREQFDTELETFLIIASTKRWKHRESGREFDSISYKQVTDLRGSLPRGEFPKLTEAIGILSLKNTVSHSAVSTPDFS